MAEVFGGKERQYVPQGLISLVEQQEESILIFRVMHALDLLIRYSPATLYPSIRCHGYEKVIMLTENEKLREGTFQAQIRQKEKIVKHPLDLYQVEGDLFLGIVHPIFEYEDRELIAEEGDMITILKTHKYTHLGKSIERFLYAGGISMSYPFFKAKERILRALGAPQPERFGWLESLSVQEAFHYNLALAQLRNVSEENNKKKSEVSFINPLLPPKFKFPSIRKKR